MKEIITTPTQHNHVTVPAEICRKLDLHTNSKVVFEIDSDEVRLRFAPFILEFAFGSIPPIKKPEPFYEYIGQAKSNLAKKHQR